MKTNTWCRWCGTVYESEDFNAMPLFGFKRTKNGLRMGRYCTFKEFADGPECRFVVTLDAHETHANELIGKILAEQFS